MKSAKFQTISPTRKSDISLSKALWYSLRKSTWYSSVNTKLGSYNNNNNNNITCNNNTCNNNPNHDA